MKIGIIGSNPGNSSYIIGRALVERGHDVIEYCNAYWSSSWPIWAEREAILPFEHEFLGQLDKEGLKKLVEFEKEKKWKNPEWFKQFQTMKFSFFDLIPTIFVILFSKYRKFIFRYLRRNFSGKQLPQSFCKICKQIKDLKKCDVVICQGWEAMIPFIANIPYIIIPYGTESLLAPSKIEYSHPLKSAYRIGVYSAYIDELLNKAGIKNKIPFHFLFDTRAYKPIKVDENSFEFQNEFKEKFIFFMPQRTHFLYKGSDKVIKSFYEITKKYKNVLLVLLDWGDDIQELKKMIKEYKIENYVLFLKNYYSDKSLNKIFNLSNVVIDLVGDGIFGFNSLGGISRGVAMAGIPLITTYYHDKNKFVNLEKPPVIHANTIDEIKSSMEYCLENKDKIKNLGEELRKWTLKYHGKSAVDELEKLLLEVKNMKS